jgi:hypothetical protein
MSGVKGQGPKLTTALPAQLVAGIMPKMSGKNVLEYWSLARGHVNTTEALRSV